MLLKRRLREKCLNASTTAIVPTLTNKPPTAAPVTTPLTTDHVSTKITTWLTSPLLSSTDNNNNVTTVTPFEPDTQLSSIATENWEFLVFIPIVIAFIVGVVAGYKCYKKNKTRKKYDCQNNDTDKPLMRFSKDSCFYHGYERIALVFRGKQVYTVENGERKCLGINLSCIPCFRVENDNNSNNTEKSNDNKNEKEGVEMGAVNLEDIDLKFRENEVTAETSSTSENHLNNTESRNNKYENLELKSRENEETAETSSTSADSAINTESNSFKDYENFGENIDQSENREKIDQSENRK
ncbi:hypothetical protein KUTeg_014279 [Tegillarca granosa]|uniref:Uncharacterized protein n=1 Tax=Tegillarca granosa TaxID=220873 RepID=A0ABQ9F1C5_TEGGR|nr:hypothetical protein KUTeg_014279 [Tegillarca granosa]